jgi:alanine dehydrogenase
LTPTTTKALIDAGYQVNVERSPQRIFDDEEYEKVGATLVEEDSWCNAPEDNIIVGLKELPVEECELGYKGYYIWQLMGLKFPLNMYMSNLHTVISSKEAGKRFLADLLEEMEFSWTLNS